MKYLFRAVVQGAIILAMLAPLASTRASIATASPPTRTLSTVSAQTSGSDIALLSENQPATATSFDVLSPPSRANDGDSDTEWESSTPGTPVFWQVDLGLSHQLTQVEVSWGPFFDRMSYTISTSENGVDFSQVLVKQNNIDAYTVDTLPTTAIGRYVRVTVTDASEEYTAVPYVSMDEVRVFGWKHLPVIFIPGISGSELWLDTFPITEKLWMGIKGTRHELLSLYPSDNPRPNIYAPDVIRSVLGNPVYGPTLDFLRQFYPEYEVENLPSRRTAAGCDLSQSANKPMLFVFAYDWRDTNSQSATRLADYINCIQQFYPSTKVNIVAHSMGGLLARRYIMDHPDAHDVNKLITIATPWLGAPKTVNVLETGDFLTDIVHQAFISRETIRDMIGSFRGALELLPSEVYTNLALRPLVREQGWDLNGNGVDTEDYSYTDLTDLLNTRYAREGFRPGQIVNSFHSRTVGGNNQDDWSSDSTGVRYYHIWGQLNFDNTIVQLQPTRRVECTTRPVAGSGSRPICRDVFDTAPVYGPGDSMVPVESAQRIGSGQNLNAPYWTEFALNSGNDPSGDRSHQNIVWNPQVLTKVFEYLRAGQAGGGTGPSNPPLVASQNAYYITISNIADGVVADGQGNSTAFVADTIRGYLPDVKVVRVGPESDTIIIPAEDEYTITFRTVTGALPTGITIRRGTGETANRLVAYQDMMLPAGVTAELQFDGPTIVNLRYDQDGDGIFESIVAPTFDRQGLQLQDLTAPSLTITQTQQQNQVLVTITAQDTGGSVTGVFYSSDGQSYQEYTGPFLLDPNSTPSVLAFAEDQAGNRSGLTEEFLAAAPVIGIGSSADTDTPGASPSVAVDDMAGDVNNDGYLDVITAGNPKGITVLLGDGTGKLVSMPTQLASHGAYRGSALADLNDDGKLDLVFHDHTTSPETLKVAFGNGSGLFGQIATYPDVEFLQDLHVEDITGDGILDVVTMSTAGGRLNGTISPIVMNSFVNQGTGTLVLGSSYTLSVVGGTSNMQLGDLNGDQLPDIVIGGSSNASQNIEIRLNTGNGTFGAPTLLTGSASVRLGDLTGDGNLDMIMGWPRTLLAGDGAGNFTPVGPVGSQGYNEYLLDIDGDQDIDLIDFVPINWGRVSILYNQGDGTFSSGHIYYTSGNGTIIPAGDFTNDGKVDFLNIPYFHPIYFADFRVFPQSSTVSFRTIMKPADEVSGSRMIGTDLNRDGRMDTVTLDDTLLRVHISGSNGTLSGNVPYTLPNGNSAHDLRAGDINGDSYPDVVTLSYTGVGHLFLGTGDGTFLPPTPLTVGSTTIDIEIADLNVDGYDDVVVTDYGSNSVQVLRGASSGVLSTPITVNTELGTVGVELADINNDQTLDIIASGHLTNEISLSLGNGDGTFGPRTAFTFDDRETLSTFYAQDFDGDGNADLVLSDSVQSRIYRGQGNGQFIAVWPDLPFAVDAASFADVNDDGFLDIATTFGSLHLSLGAGDGTFKNVVYPIPSPSMEDYYSALDLAIGDVNGDRRLDITIRGLTVYLRR